MLIHQQLNKEFFNICSEDEESNGIFGSLEEENRNRQHPPNSRNPTEMIELQRLLSQAEYHHQSKYHINITINMTFYKVIDQGRHIVSCRGRGKKI